MRVPRVRFTVRRLMVVVGMTALILGLILGMRRQSAAYHQRAEAYAAMRRFGSGVVDDPVHAWASEMAEKYWRLSDYPWLPAGPDKPPPTEARSWLTEPLEPKKRPNWARLSFRLHSRPPRWTLLWHGH